MRWLMLTLLGLVLLAAGYALGVNAAITTARVEAISQLWSRQLRDMAPR